jgi:hypothetical protein
MPQNLRSLAFYCVCDAKGEVLLNFLAQSNIVACITASAETLDRMRKINLMFAGNGCMTAEQALSHP